MVKLTEIPLTDQGKVFVTEFLKNGKNASAAFRAAFPHLTFKKALDCTKRAMEYKNTPAIKNALKIAESREMQKIGRVMERYAVTQERITEEIAKIAFAQAGDFASWGPDGVAVKDSADLSDEAKAAIAEVSETKGKEGTTVKVKPYDKLQALQALGKTLGMFQEKVQHEHKHLSVQFVITDE